MTPVSPLSIVRGALSIDLTAYAKTSNLAAYSPKFTALLPLTVSASNALSIDLSAYQGKITVSAPLAMSATNALSVDLSPYALASSLSSYALSSALSSYAAKITTTLPLALWASNVLSVDLSGYQKNFIVGPPLVMTETTMSSGGTNVSVPTLILDMSDYATIESLWAYQTQLSVSAPLALTASGALSINTSGFQPAFGIKVPTTGQVQLFNSTLNLFQALAPGAGITLTTSTDGKTATIAAMPIDLSGSATTAALASYAPKFTATLL